IIRLSNIDEQQTCDFEDQTAALPQRKTESEQCSAAEIASNCYVTSMHAHDFSDDCKPQTRAITFPVSSSPETVKDALSVLERHAASPIEHPQPPIRINRDDHLLIGRRMKDGIFDKVADCILYGIAVGSKPDRPVSADECNCPFLRDGPGGDVFHHHAC